jgi:hypothetical protein
MKRQTMIMTLDEGLQKATEIRNSVKIPAEYKAWVQAYLTNA